MKERAISYVRVSSKHQDLDRQINELDEFSKTKNLRLVKCFKDTSSASKSFINEREGFNNLKDYLELNKNVKHVLVHEVSRLGRKNFEVQNVIEEFYQLGVNIHFRDLNISTLDNLGNKSAESSIIISILGSMAENETRLLAERIKSGLLNSAKKGLAFKKITGYFKGLDGRPEINKDVAPIVKRMFELASEEVSLYFISKKIEQEFNRVYHPKTVSGIIKNPFYKGERRYLKETILVDKIVDAETWQKANEYLSSRKMFTKRYRVNENIVEGKIVCRGCNSTMYQFVASKSRADLFKCSQSCSISVNRPWLYEMIRYVVHKHTEKIKDKEFKVNLKDKIDENEQLLKDFLISKNNLERAQLNNYEKYLLNNVKESIYEHMNSKFEKELTRIELNLNDCNKKKKSYLLALQIKPQHYSDDLKTFKIQIKNILKEVEVGKDFVTININDVLKYTIPQINPTKLGWIRRKSKGEKMIFQSPFDTGIRVRNVISDEDLGAMIEAFNFEEDEIDDGYDNETVNPIDN